MNSKRNDLIMIDYAARDSRSTKANLLGRGADRDKLYQVLLMRVRSHAQEAIQSGRHAADPVVASAEQSSANTSGTALASFARLVLVPVVGLLLGVMVYQVFF